MQEMRLKIFIILSIILLLIGILLLNVVSSYKSMQINHYQIDNNTYYEVTLNPNNYFSNNINTYYIASAIKNIDIHFNYHLKNNTEDNINYSYNITATLKSYVDNGTKLIWTKDFNLENNHNINNKDAIITKAYNLDYQYYVNYVKSFQKYYNIKTESYLYVKLNMKINDKDANVIITIPVSDNVIEITIQENHEFLNTNNQNINLNKIEVMIFIVIIIVILTIKSYLSKKSDTTLLKEYQDIIINVNNKPNSNDNVIYLTKLKDLINIAINYNLNIFNYQNNYYLIKDNTYYIYILKKA